MPLNLLAAQHNKDLFKKVLSLRCKDFLEFVVQSFLEGQLKEI